MDGIHLGCLYSAG